MRPEYVRQVVENAHRIRSKEHSGTAKLNELNLTDEFKQMIVEAVYIDSKYTNLIVLTTMFYAESKRGRLARGLTKKKQNAAARKVAKPKPLLDTLANYNIWAKEQEATEAAEASSAASHAA